MEQLSSACLRSGFIKRLALLLLTCPRFVDCSSAKIYKYVLDNIDSSSTKSRSDSFQGHPAFVRRAQSTNTGDATDLSARQQAILIRLYSDTNGPFWAKSTNWLSDSVSECSWFGVKCNEAGEITSITLEDNKLYGTTPEELFDLSTLLSIDFRQNPVDIKFDKIGNASNLHTLIASDAAVWKLNGIGSAASSLRFLHLTNNDLEGPLPDELFKLVNLEELFLNYNHFTGPLPTEIGQLKKLSELYLMENGLSGQLPSQLGNCEQLTELSLGENHFTGTIPQEILTKLTNLRILALQQEKQPSKDGYGLSGPLPDFAALSSLREIYLAGNHYTGTIPSSLLSGSSNSNMNNVVTIDLADNYLTGSVPGSLADHFNNLNLIIHGNDLTSLDTALCSKSQWNHGDVGKYGCDAIACPIGTYSTMGRRSADNDLVKTCYTCDGIGYEAAYLGSTECVLEQKKILQHFYNLTGGNDGMWYNFDNWDNIDEWDANGTTVCDMYGITCEHEQDEYGLDIIAPSAQVKIVAIDLSNNGLAGRMPHEIFNIPYLRDLNLRDNLDLEVRLYNIEAAKELAVLTVSNTTLVDWTGLGNATNLTELRMSDLGLKKQFPSELFELTNLQTLYLSYNKFKTTLPSKLTKLSKLEYFYCYDCQLVGPMDGDILGALQNLKELSLGMNSLTGTVPLKVWQLPALSFLSLDENPLSMSFNYIGESQSLRELRLSNMGITSISGIGKATALETLHLTDNALDGPIPEELFEIKTLKHLFLNYNRLSGNLSSSIQNLQGLEELFIYANQLSGQIPSQIGLLKNLTTLALAENKIIGTLPTELNQCTNLSILALQRENDDEEGITGPLLAFDNLPELKEICLGGNNLVGTIPGNFLAGSNHKSDLTIYVDLLDNALTGIIPSTLSEFNSMKLLLKGNKISGIAEELCSKNDWMEGEVGDYGCSAILCPSDFYSEIGRQASGSTPCVVCGTDTFATYFGSVACTDQNGDLVMSERQILEQFYNALDGPNWRHTDEWLIQETSVCNWYGITCSEIDGAERITTISLEKNLLVGTVPPSIFRLTHLSILALSDNDVDLLFDTIDRAENLTVLKLSNTQVRSMKGIGNPKSLTSLHMQDNHMKGPILDEFFNLVQLQHVYMSNNDLTGTLPEGIGYLGNLTVLHLYGNLLKGQIPESIENLLMLQVLDLAENDFTGTLPNALNMLTDLTILNLHQWTRDHNGIGGPLLDFSDLTNLQELYLDSNSLTGTIPASLMSSSNRTFDQIKVGIASNKLTGTLPADLQRFENLYIDVTDNMLTGIADELCSMTKWMNNGVGKFGCEAIMCSKGKYNTKAGRKSGSSDTCSACTDPNEAPYFGTLHCGETSSGQLTEVAILEKFYYYTGGRYWTNQTNWLEDSVDVCRWSGVTCNSNGNVMSLVLDSNQVSGRLHPSLFTLPALSILSLKDNPLKFSFDGIEAATNLKELLLSGSGVSSVKGVSKASNLVSLHLTDNNIQGYFPVELYQLSSLQSLFLDYNRISGIIPKELTVFKNLEELYLFNNRFTGQIPSELGLMTSLRTLALSENDLTGTLPQSLEQLTNLEVLALQQRNKPDSGIKGPLLDFSTMSNLKVLYLGPNELTGTISPGFLSGIINTGDTIEIDLSFNRLEGGLPLELERFDQLEIRLQGNQFTGIEVDLCSQFLWNGGMVGKYGCEAIMCSHDTYNDLGRATSDNPCQACPDGSSTNGLLGSTKCVSALEQQTLVERAILNKFFSDMNGPQWRMSYRWNDPDTPICEWQGIKCPSDGTETVLALYLPKNSLQGTVPSEIFGLPNLKEINLGGNQITFVFTGIERAISLQELNLDSTGLISIDGIGQASGLKSLHLRSNNLQGSIPLELTTLTSLTELDISDNSFEGSLPADMRNLGSLESLSCFNNQISGELPSWLGDLYNLVYLRMGQNDFSGSIPSSMESLIYLEHLDLSNQTHFGGKGITGSLPSFSSNKYLKDLNLSNNGFSGTIPSTFLSSTDQSASVSIDLRSNFIQGSIPVELQQFQSLSIYLAENAISSIDTTMCQEQILWMKGNVQEFGCDAILCEPHTFNAGGFQSSLASECEPCPQNTIAPYYGSTACIMTPRGVLTLFYQATGGQDGKWKSSENWMSNSNICTWEGITCNEQNQTSSTIEVKSIELPSNGLVGETPRELFDLLFLEKLDLSNNDVELKFEGIARASKISVINIDSTKTTSLQGISDARGLVSLNSQKNDFGGADIAEEIFSLYRLEDLFLTSSKFSGTLSTRIGDLAKLKRLYLSDNEIRGEIPRQIGKLSQLQELVLSENDWTGTIPETFSLLTQLKKLQIDEFTRTNGGLEGTLPELSGLSQITLVSFGGNKLSGTIPKAFLDSATSISEEVQIILTGNKLTGTLPASLSRFDNLIIDVTNNQINAIAPSICEKEKWMRDRVGLYGCDALLCPLGTHNTHGRQSNNDMPCLPCSGMNTAEFLGSVECTLDSAKNQEREILLKFYNSCNGPNWHKQQNWTSPDVDICHWEGLSCSRGKSIDSMLLGANNIEGTPPKELFDLPALEWLWLYSNQISFSFDGIGNATKLRSLILDSTGLSSIQGIGEAKSLIELEVRFNKLQGPLPRELAQLGNIESLSISDNELTGSLPRWLENLENLRKLRLGSNKLSGPLLSFASSSQLISLDLSENMLSGPIPTNLLEKSSGNSDIFIDLSDNQLTGTVPASLNRFEQLTLYLRNNNFEAISPEVCTNAAWNDGDVGDFGCDGLLCPQGSFGPLGRQSKGSGGECQPCAENEYVGRTECSSGFFAFHRTMLGLLIIICAAFTLIHL